jgi:NTP pyrophosphatase (non-canonical NTP hydrolase)
MSELTFSKLRKANVKRCEDVFHPLDSWSPSDWATAMAGECGEACNNIKKLRRLDGADADFDTEINRKRLIYETGKELADLVIYADLLAARLGINLGYMVTNKFNEVSENRGSKVTL